MCIDFLHILTFPCLLFCFIVYFLEILGGDFTRTGNICSLCLYLSVNDAHFSIFFQLCVSDGMVLLRPGNKCIATVFQDCCVTLDSGNQSVSYCFGNDLIFPPLFYIFMPVSTEDYIKIL